MVAVSGGKNPKMIPISVHIPEAYVKMMDDLVQKGYFATRSELLRYAVRQLLQNEFKFAIEVNE
jgi:Predicted transcriptional regulators containing the CopG/Arc/MetJ DNA-binding domain